MSLVYTGNSRARKVTVTKYVNGVPQSPVTYPTNVDMANGFFTYSNGTVNIPAIDGDTPHDELSQLTEVQYAAYLIALQTYAQEQNPGLNFATATVVPGYTAVITDDPNCPEPGTPVGTTTTTPEPSSTTTTPEPVVTTTTPEGETGVCYNVRIPTAALTDGGNDLYVTRKVPGGALTDIMAIMLFDTGEWNDGIVTNICCVDYPLFKYGEAGAYFDPNTESIVIQAGVVCTEDGQCTSPTTTTTTPSV
jgi:hypothetical protein